MIAPSLAAMSRGKLFHQGNLVREESASRSRSLNISLMCQSLRFGKRPSRQFRRCILKRSFELVVDLPAPQIWEDIVEVGQSVPHEYMSERIGSRETAHMEFENN